MPDTRDEKERLREKVAAEHGIQLYRRYGERQAAETIGWNYATLKRKRRAGLVPFVDLGGGSVGYMGYQIADIIAYGVKAKDEARDGEFDGTSNGAATSDRSGTWPNTASATTRSASGGSDSAPGRPATTPSATTPTASATSALALARQTLK
jgi:hypothetical protein